jgi:hypothetical protein
MSEQTRLLDRIILPEGLPAKSIDFPWYGPTEHLAPNASTPLSKALKSKTNSALCTLAAGALLWSAQRLRYITGATPLFLVAEVMLLWEDDPRYYHHPGPSPKPATITDAYHATAALFRQAAGIIVKSPGNHISSPPIQDVENIFALTRHVIGEDWIPAFRDWTVNALAVLDQLAPNPHQDFTSRHDYESDADWEAHKALNMGPPIAIEVLNHPPGTIDPVQSSALYRNFMLAVQPKENRYLATPELMISLGFPGKPYVPKAR